jgi:hypothetical protein
VATLPSIAGRSHELPRWLPDGVHLLVSRDAPVGDGTTRPDLFVWNHRTGSLRRLTRGAGIRSADPAPDGRTAAAVRCAAGICSIVSVDLSSGAWRVLVAGTPEAVWHRPRWSPDGRRIAAGYQAGPTWRVAIIDAASGAVRVLQPAGDSASRYAPAWTPDGRDVVAVSERGGIANLERMNVETGSISELTRVTGSVLAPDVDRAESVVYYLTLHAKGYDLRRIPLAAPPAATVALDESLAPAAPRRAFTAPPFAAESLPPARGYGTGPRLWRILPGVVSGSDGLLGTLMAANVDPISRLSLVAQAGMGRRGTWRGGAVSGAVRAFPITLEPALWHVDRRPAAAASGRVPTAHEIAYTGGGLAASYARDRGVYAYAARAGVSHGSLRGNLLDGASRSMAFGAVAGSANYSTGARTLAGRGSLQVATGETADQTWARATVAGRLVAGPRRYPLIASATFGKSTATGPGELGRAFEEFVVGGSELPYFDPIYVAQFVPLPGVPLGFARGRHLGTVRLSIGGSTFEPFASWIAAGDRLDRWQRVIGIERAITVSSYGFARLPEVRARGGASYSIDEPFRRKARAWVSLSYRP